MLKRLALTVNRERGNYFTKLRSKKERDGVENEKLEKKSILSLT